MSQFNIRALTTDDWEKLHHIRIEMVSTNPEAFLENEEAARARPKKEWIKRLSSPISRHFGYFKGTELVGLIGIFSHNKLPKDVLEIGMNYTSPAYRSKGLTTLGYKHCLTYAKSLTGYKEIHVSHREGNIASRSAILKAGFEFQGYSRKTYGDNKESTSYNYIYKLK